MSNKEIIDLANKNLTQNYSRNPVALVKGKGSSVWDAEGKKYLDFVTGLAVCNLGHCFSPVNKAIQKQVGKLMHTSNLFYTEPQSQLAEALVEKMYKGKVFFCNSGTEANEAALKLARRYSIEKFDKKKTEIIAFDGAFHGRTMGALSMTADSKFKDGFGPMLSGVKHVPFGDLAAVEKAMNAKTCAVIVEPVQGEAGVRVPSAAFMQKLAKLCSSKKALLILDEVQSGFGRTGRLFAFEHYKIKPDIVTMAKGIANGLPMGAMFAKPEIAKYLDAGSHAATFGGNPVVCAGALAALEELSKDELLENVRELGRYAIIKLNGMKSNVSSIKEVRGMGLMIGLELTTPCASVVDGCAAAGLLVNCANETTIRLLPPLNVTRKELDKALNIIGKVLGV